MRRSWPARLLTLVFALLHLTVPPLVTVADARVQESVARSGPPRVHVESHGDSRCPQVHPTDCGLCQAVATFAVPARVPPVAPPVVVAFAVPAELRLGTETTGGPDLALPRAPPSL